MARKVTTEDIKCTVAAPYDEDGGTSGITTENYTDYFDVTIEDNVITIGLKETVTETNGALLSFEIGDINVVVDFYLGE